MSWSIQLVGTHDAVLASVESKLGALLDDKAQAPLESSAATFALTAIREAMKFKVPDDYFGIGTTAGWSVGASAAFSAEGMLTVTVSVDRSVLTLGGHS